jgi:ABC-type phosphate transport system substrate-binding protein
MPKPSKHLRRTAAAIVATLVVVASDACADVKVHGATTVAFGLMNPQKSKIEQLAHVEVTVLPSSTSHGLADLVQGKADIAMLAEPLVSIAASMNGKQPGFIDLAAYEDRHVGNAYVQFIIHPGNPLETLNKAQLAALFSGQVKNWQEIGGSNLPVLLVGEPTSSPHRLIKEALGIAYSPDLRIVQNTNQTALIVAQAPGAISYITTAHDLAIRDKLKVAQSDLQVPLELHLALRKDASDDVRRVVEAAAKLGGR